VNAHLRGMLYIPRPMLHPGARALYHLPNPAYEQEINNGAYQPKSSPFIEGTIDAGIYVGFPPYADRTFLFSKPIPIIDGRSTGSPLLFTFNEEKAVRERPILCADQKRAVEAMIAQGHGILVAKPGHGKTNVMIWLTSLMGLSTIIFTHTGQLMEQWYKRFTEPDPKDGERWTDLDPSKIVLIGDGDKKYNDEPLCIAMLQTTHQSLLEDKEFCNRFGNCLFDENHHASAETYAKCIGAINARHKFGCTATPYRTDKLDRIFLDHLGGITFKMKDTGLNPTISMIRTHLGIDLTWCVNRMGKPNLTKIIGALVKSPLYNDLLMSRIKIRMAQKRKTLLLSNRVNHCIYLADEVRKLGYDSTFIVGSYKTPEGKTKKMSIQERESRYGAQFISATFKCMAEGIDIPPLESLIFGTPFGASTIVEQGAGRVVRDWPNKQDPTVDDFMLTDHGMLISLARKRLGAYKRAGWTIITL